MTQLPLDIDTSGALALSAVGLRFNFLLAVSTLDDLAPNMYAGAYVDLPGFLSSLLFVADENETCDTVSAASIDPALPAVSPNLLVVQTNASVSLGGAFGVGSERTGFTFTELDIDENIAVEIALPDVCLVKSTDSDGVVGFKAPGAEDSSAAGKTSSSTPSKTSGAAGATSSNAASSNTLRLSDLNRFSCAAGMLTFVFLVVGTVL